MITDVLLVLLAMCCVVVPAKTCSSSPLEASGSRRFIVRFNEYKPVAQHVNAMSGILGAPSSSLWQLAGARRHPLATALPTDFAVISLDPRAEGSIVATLERSAAVKGVDQDAVVTASGTLASAPAVSWLSEPARGRLCTPTARRATSDARTAAHGQACAGAAPACPDSPLGAGDRDLSIPIGRHSTHEE